MRSDSGSVSYARDLWRRREFAFALASSRLRARNASTYLGVIWWVLNPLLLAAIYFFVFGLLFDRGDDYLAYLLSGIFPFYFTSGSMTGASAAILGNSRMIANLKFPRLLLPLSSIIEAAIGFGFSLVAFYLIVMPVEGVYPTRKTLLLVPIVLMHLVFNTGLASLVARLAVPFRDINNLIPYLLRVWLYLSPIIWPLSLIDDLGAVGSIAVRLNPLFSYLSLYRTALAGAPFESSMMGYALIWTLVIGVFGIWSFVRYEGEIVKHL